MINEYLSNIYQFRMTKTNLFYTLFIHVVVVVCHVVVCYPYRAVLCTAYAAIT